MRDAYHVSPTPLSTGYEVRAPSSQWGRTISEGGAHAEKGFQDRRLGSGDVHGEFGCDTGVDVSQPNSRRCEAVHEQKLTYRGETARSSRVRSVQARDTREVNRSGAHAVAPIVDLSEYAENGVVRVRRRGELVSDIVLPGRLQPKSRNGETVAAPWADSLGKRAFDIVSSLLILVIALPVMGLVALAIWIEDGRPIVFSQPRAGKGGKPFRFLKFRSMIRDAEARKAALLQFNESLDGVIFKMRADPRITRVGAFIRRTSLDELPQIFHVLTGKMSLVGPRPHPVSEAATYSTEERVRLATKPGITCLWQIMGRSDLPFGQQVILDRLYIEHQSLWLDLKIVLKTIPAVLFGKGAY